MSAPLTVLHLTHEGHGAGSSISIALLARAQRAAGHRVIVGCPGDSYLSSLVSAGGLEHVPLAFERSFETRAAIQALVRGESVDVINAHSSKDRAACRRLRLLGRLRPALVMTRRGMPMSTPLSAVLSGLAADRTIAVSRPVARSLVRRGTPPWRVAVVPNAVDLSRLDAPLAPGSRERVARLIGADVGAAPRPTIGVVSRRKEHATLLAALAFVSAPVTLCLIGFEPDEALQRAPVAQRHRLVWLPFQRDVRPFYDLFDVVALVGRHEGLSQGLLEAMALGKPVVAVRAGGNTDVVTHLVHGLLVPPRQPRALGAALERLVADHDLRRRLGAAARQRARDAFTIERTSSLTEAVYRAAVARRNGR